MIVKRDLTLERGVGHSYGYSRVSSPFRKRGYHPSLGTFPATVWRRSSVNRSGALGFGGSPRLPGILISLLPQSRLWKILAHA